MAGKEDFSIKGFVDFFEEKKTTFIMRYPIFMRAVTWSIFKRALLLAYAVRIPRQLYRVAVRGDRCLCLSYVRAKIWYWRSGELSENPRRFFRFMLNILSYKQLIIWLIVINAITIHIWQLTGSLSWLLRSYDILRFYSLFPDPKKHIRILRQQLRYSWFLGKLVWQFMVMYCTNCTKVC